MGLISNVVDPHITGDAADLALWWGFVSKGEIWCSRGLFSNVIPKPIVFINHILLYSNLILNWGFTLYIVATTKYNSQIRKRNCSLIKIYKNTNFLIPIIHKKHEHPLKVSILLPSCNHHITPSKLKNNCTQVQQPTKDKPKTAISQFMEPMLKQKNQCDAHFLVSMFQGLIKEK